MFMASLKYTPVEMLEEYISNTKYHIVQKLYTKCSLNIRFSSAKSENNQAKCKLTYCNHSICIGLVAQSLVLRE